MSALTVPAMYETLTELVRDRVRNIARYVSDLRRGTISIQRKPFATGADVQAFRLTACSTWSRRRAIAAIAGGAFGAAARMPVLAQAFPAVRLGTGDVGATPQAYFATDAGFFQKAGLDVHLSVIRGGTNIIAAASAGDIDVGEASTIAFGSAILRGLPLVAIAPGIVWDPQLPSAGLVGPLNATVRSGADLNGKTIGVNELAALGVIGIKSYMDATGGDLSTVKFIEIPNAALADAVAAGRVDFAELEEPLLSDAIQAKKVKFVVAAMTYIAPSFFENVWFSRADWPKQNPDLAKRVANAIIAASTWAETNRSASGAIIAKYAKANVSSNTVRYGRSLDPVLVQSAWNAAFKYKLYSSLPKATDHCWDGK